jgi:hypothetical protein
VRDPGGEGKEAGAECMQDASKWGTDTPYCQPPNGYP